MAYYCNPSYTYAMAIAQEEGQDEEKTALSGASHTTKILNFNCSISHF